MAKAKCSAKIGRFRWNREGYAEVMDGGEAQALVEGHASRMLSACLASSPGYVAKPVRGRLASGYIVGTGDAESANDAHRSNTLQRNLRGGG